MKKCVVCGEEVENEVEYCPVCKAKKFKSEIELDVETNAESCEEEQYNHNYSARSQTSGYCKNCLYLHYAPDRLIHKYWCKYLSDAQGNYQVVSETGSCSNFTPRPTKANSNYSGCFLTSACVEYQGKADDCCELTTLRKFRDTYMQSSEEGKKLIKDYYDIAPKIVEEINVSSRKGICYLYISEVIEKCVSFIEHSENERALIAYKLMVLNLKKEFNVQKFSKPNENS